MKIVDDLGDIFSQIGDTAAYHMYERVEESSPLPLLVRPTDDEVMEYGSWETEDDDELILDTEMIRKMNSKLNLAWENATQY